MKTCRIWCLELAVVLLAGCGAEALGVDGDTGNGGDGGRTGVDFGDAGSEVGGAGGGVGGGDAGIGGDIGTGGIGGTGGQACEPPAVDIEGTCVLFPTERSEVCKLVLAFDAGCTDLDGDCYPGTCTGALPSGYAPYIFDCDEGRPDVHPFATEQCNGLDDDCNGLTDEPFHLGELCETTCGEGVIECAVGDPTTIACSTSAGQSADPGFTEVCDGDDDDCDGVIDDDCALDLEVDTVPGSLALCGTQLVYFDPLGLQRVDVSDDAVVAGIVPAQVAAIAEQPDAPACSAEGLAWRRVAGRCDEPEDGPASCFGHIVGLPAGGSTPVALAEVDEQVGRPTVLGNTAYWHVLGPDGPRLWGRVLDASAPAFPILPQVPLSDPAAGADARLAVREWVNGSAVVELQEPSERGSSTVVDNPTGSPGLPVVGAGWIVWPVGTPIGLWAVQFSPEVGHGFLAVSEATDQVAPVLDGTHLLWIDRGTTPATLRELDLSTGLGRVVARGELTAGRVAASDGLLVYGLPSGRRTVLYRARLPVAAP